MENQHPSNCRKQIMEQELIRGRDTANQLLEVIVNKLNINLHHNGDLEGDEEVLPITIKDLSSPAKCPKLEETDHEACKSYKLQRGCYKRK
ncbi:hypothetical protein TSUD_53810 [Trifolium subterraneum]|uniref:Uncharacterized protein n=1 Tax=Trifolium subterraneum TaxID=3900 RepID=A0A2Z6MI45_TRISU|nr:hypothetical protein TSUD_53810 [Trifolium subterraneum]